MNPSSSPTTSPRLTSTAIRVLSRCSAIPVKAHSDSSVRLPLEICPKSPMFNAANRACEAMKPYAMWEIWRTCVRGSGTREPSAELASLKEAVRVVDHEEPGAIGLPARDLGALPLRLHRLAVGPGALQHPLRRRQGDASGLGERAGLECHPGFPGDKAAERFANGFGTGNDLAGLHRERRCGFVELDHGLDVAGVDRLDEQHVEFLRLASGHGSPPVRLPPPNYFTNLDPATLSKS